MTIPNLMNCEHSSDGVCIACVQKLIRAERVAAELRCAKTPVILEGHHAYTALQVQQMMMDAVSMRSNVK